MFEIRETHLMAADGTPLAAYTCGSGEGPPLVLSHGLGGNIAAWRYLVDNFGGHHRIVSWDYRGLYRSGPAAPPSDYTVPTHVADMGAVMDHVGVDRAVLVGWSMGCQVNLEMLRAAPQRVLGLVLINGTFGRAADRAPGPSLGDWLQLAPKILRGAESFAPTLRHLRHLLPDLARSQLLLEFLRGAGLVGDTADRRLFAELAGEMAGLDPGVYLATLNALGAHCAKASLPDVQVPTLVIAGDRDLFTPVANSERVAKQIDGAELMVIPSGTHYTPLEFPELVDLRIEKFVRERLGFNRSAARGDAGERPGVTSRRRRKRRASHQPD